ncbi:hypothetical protein MBLNU230_g0192t1 [Neophaeotheca triangularis]
MLLFFIFIATVVSARIPIHCLVGGCGPVKATPTAPNDDGRQPLRLAASTLSSVPTATAPSSQNSDDAEDDRAPETTAPPGVITAPDGSCVVQSICVDWLTCGSRGGTCYDQNGCNGAASTYKAPTCETRAVRRGFARRREFVREWRVEG